jgi:hypothetical protein
MNKKLIVFKRHSHQDMLESRSSFHLIACQIDGLGNIILYIGQNTYISSQELCLMQEQFCLIYFLFYFNHLSELKALELQTGYFHLRQIKAATDNFNPANKIGEGGFGPVYKVNMHFDFKAATDNFIFQHS